jgi:hypothetical protein
MKELGLSEKLILEIPIWIWLLEKKIRDFIKLISYLKMETAGSSEGLVPIFKTTRRYVSKERILIIRFFSHRSRTRSDATNTAHDHSSNIVCLFFIKYNLEQCVLIFRHPVQYSSSKVGHRVELTEWNFNHEQI